jgi:hypothetical protein
MSAEKLREVDAIVDGLIAEKKLAGATVARRGKVVHFGAYGQMDFEAGKMSEWAVKGVIYDAIETR